MDRWWLWVGIQFPIGRILHIGVHGSSGYMKLYPMFIEPTITWVPSGFSGYIWLDTEIVFKKNLKKREIH